VTFRVNFFLAAEIGQVEFLQRSRKYIIYKADFAGAFECV
jgi:hypothetical protein